MNETFLETKETKHTHGGVPQRPWSQEKCPHDSHGACRRCGIGHAGQCRHPARHGRPVALLVGPRESFPLNGVPQLMFAMPTGLLPFAPENKHSQQQQGDHQARSRGDQDRKGKHHHQPLGNWETICATHCLVYCNDDCLREPQLSSLIASLTESDAKGCVNVLMVCRGAQETYVSRRGATLGHLRFAFLEIIRKALSKVSTLYCHNGEYGASFVSRQGYFPRHVLMRVLSQQLLGASQLWGKSIWPFLRHTLYWCSGATAFDLRQTTNVRAIKLTSDNMTRFDSKAAMTMGWPVGIADVSLESWQLGDRLENDQFRNAHVLSVTSCNMHDLRHSGTICNQLESLTVKSSFFQSPYLFGDGGDRKSSPLSPCHNDDVSFANLRSLCLMDSCFSANDDAEFVFRERTWAKLQHLVVKRVKCSKIELRHDPTSISPLETVDVSPQYVDDIIFHIQTPGLRSIICDTDGNANDTRVSNNTGPSLIASIMRQTGLFGLPENVTYGQLTITALSSLVELRLIGYVSANYDPWKCLPTWVVPAMPNLSILEVAINTEFSAIHIASQNVPSLTRMILGAVKDLRVGDKVYVSFSGRFDRVTYVEFFKEVYCTYDHRQPRAKWIKKTKLHVPNLEFFRCDSRHLFFLKLMYSHRPAIHLGR